MAAVKEEDSEAERASLGERQVTILGCVEDEEERATSSGTSVGAASAVSSPLDRPDIPGIIRPSLSIRSRRLTNWVCFDRTTSLKR